VSYGPELKKAYVRNTQRKRNPLTIKKSNFKKIKRKLTKVSEYCYVQLSVQQFLLPSHKAVHGNELIHV